MNKGIINKQRQSAEVNSSYSLFFLIAVLAVAYVFTNTTIINREFSLPATIGYALVFYVTWDLIKQLYSPGQSLILYSFTFIILPYLLALTMGDEGYFIALAGFVTWFIAVFIAVILEVAYELFTKTFVSQNIQKRLFAIDNDLDKSLLSFNDRHLSYFNFKGIIVYGLIMLVYFSVLTLLFK